MGIRREECVGCERAIGFVTGSMQAQHYRKRWLTTASRLITPGDPNPLNFMDAYADSQDDFT